MASAFLPRTRRIGLITIVPAVLFGFTSLSAQSGVATVPLGPATLWGRAEFRIDNLPATANPFDPDLLRLDAVFKLPSGKLRVVPAFWFQDYRPTLSGASESLVSVGNGEWRIRFTPPEPGGYRVSLNVWTNGQSWAALPAADFSVPEGPPRAGSGYVQVAASRQYFETGDGQSLRLVGENVGWAGSRGTYDYDDWFGAMSAVGENYARLWMCPWNFGLETDSNSLTHYRLDRAWQLDYVLQLAERRGIHVLLCLDYHGMFEVTPDYWGGNNYWPSNPYNRANGGPCVNQNGFFTNSVAKTTYQKRLRYLVARYGYSPNLLAWQFLNEIDNVYAYLNPSDVAAWHGVMGQWFHTNDPYHHLVTTSLTGSSDRPEIWSLPQLDFTTYHSYGEPGPDTRLRDVAQSFLRRYGKPILIDEFGTDWRGWNRAADPFLRGFRQGLWGGALGGSVGTAMPWYWQNIQSENVYPVYTALRGILNRTAWGRGSWTDIGFKSSGTPPGLVGDLIAGGLPFASLLSLDSGWGDRPSGQLAIASPTSASFSASTLNCFFHGSAHADLRVPFRLDAWLGTNARVVMHLNSVSTAPILAVRADGSQLFRTNLPNLDGYWSVTNEYNLDLAVHLPSGKHLIEITNLGVDWFYLDWVRLEQVLPAEYANNWQPSPEAIGLQNTRESLVYVVAPGASFPGSATNVDLPVQENQTVTMTNWPAGVYFADWYDPPSGTWIGNTRATITNQNLVLQLPEFREDVAGVIYAAAVLQPRGFDPAGLFQFEFTGGNGSAYSIEKSGNFSLWSPLVTVTNGAGAILITDPSSAGASPQFYRAKQNSN